MTKRGRVKGRGGGREMDREREREREREGARDGERKQREEPGHRRALNEQMTKVKVCASRDMATDELGGQV